MRPPRIFTLVVALVFAAVVLVPVGAALLPAFLGGGSDSGAKGSVLFGPRHAGLALNSLTLATGTTALCLLIGVALALLLGRTDLKGWRLLLALQILPVLIPPYIHAISWSRLSPLIQRLTGGEIHSLWGAIMVLSMAYFPFVSLATLAGLRSLDRSVEESARLSRGPWATLGRITLPLAAPHILAGGALVFILSMADFGVPDILRVRVYPIEIFIQYSAFYNEAGAAMLALPLVALSVLALVVLMRALAGRSYVQWGSSQELAERIPLGRLQAVALGFCGLVLGLAVGVPVLALVHAAAPLRDLPRILAGAFPEVSYTLLLSTGGALMAVILGAGVAWSLERSALGGKIPWELLALLSLAVPATSMGLGLIRIWNRPALDGLYESSIAVCMGYLARFIPFAVIFIRSGFRQIGPSVEESAWLHGRGRLHAMGSVLLPLLRPSLIAAFFVVFVLSFGELGTTLLVVPPGKETVSLKIYNLMHYGAESSVAVLCLLVMGVILFCSGAFLALERRLLRRMG